MPTLTEMKNAPTIDNFRYLRKKVDQFKLWQQKEKYRKEATAIKSVATPKMELKSSPKAKPPSSQVKTRSDRFDRSIKMPLKFSDLSKAEYRLVIDARRAYLRRRMSARLAEKSGYQTDRDYEELWAAVPGKRGHIKQHESLRCYRQRVGFSTTVYAELVPSLKNHYQYVEDGRTLWTTKYVWKWFVEHGYA